MAGEGDADQSAPPANGAPAEDAAADDAAAAAPADAAKAAPDSPSPEGQDGPRAGPAGKAKQKPVKRRPPPPDDDDCCTCFCCGIATVVTLLLLVCGFGAAYALDAPLPWHMVGLGPMQLTKETWDEHTAGKTVFVKMFAPWCGHCKRMAPAWHSLSRQYKNHETVMVADVDCIGAGKSLCEELGVRGFPTIKYGDPASLSEYSGGRSYKELADFAAGLGPVCSPANLGVCTAEKKAQIETFRRMSAEQREEKIKTHEQEVAKIEKDFKALVDGISARYKTATDKKEEAVKAIRDGGLNLLKAVEAYKSKPETG